MTSRQKLIANRKNAQLSTGPTTKDGKQSSSQNARTHGILSRRTVLPDEDPAEFELLRMELAAESKPEGCLERLLVDRIAACLWRLARISRIEADIVALDYIHHNDIRDQGMLLPLPSLRSSLKISLDNSIKLGMKRLEAERPHLLGRFFVRNEHDGVFTNLMRYEAAVARELQRALRELEHQQDRRYGRPGPMAGVSKQELSKSSI